MHGMYGMEVSQKNWVHILLMLILGGVFFYFLVQGFVYQNSGAFDAFTVWLQYFIALLAVLLAKWFKHKAFCNYEESEMPKKKR